MIEGMIRVLAFYKNTQFKITNFNNKNISLPYYCLYLKEYIKLLIFLGKIG